MKRSLLMLSLSSAMLFSGREASAITTQTVVKTAQILSGAVLSIVGFKGFFSGLDAYFSAYNSLPAYTSYKPFMFIIDDTFLCDCFPSYEAFESWRSWRKTANLDCEWIRYAGIREGRDTIIVGALALGVGLYLLYKGLIAQPVDESKPSQQEPSQQEIEEFFVAAPEVYAPRFSNYAW